MKAALCTKYGPPNVVKITEIEKPVPKDNEVLIRIYATTVASGDCRVRGRDFPKPLGLIMRLILGIRGPRRSVLGTELSGEIEAVGKNVDTFRPGDAVFAMTGMKFGAHAEYIVLPKNGKIISKPKNATYEQAAAITFGGTSAMHFLRKGRIQKGQRVLIYGASGAVGTYAVQLAKYFGAEVTGVCSTENVPLIKTLGADHTVDYKKEDFRNQEQRYDIIFDAVGKIKKRSCKNALTANGKFVTVASGPAAELMEDLILLKELIESNKIEPVIDRVYDLEQIVEAYEYVETGRKKGNVVIKIS
jgi:NADPH:quinone reductase and related Zn-dependent oxidoreductases